ATHPAPSSYRVPVPESRLSALFHSRFRSPVGLAPHELAGAEARPFPGLIGLRWRTERQPPASQRAGA
nr:hypothetical protein [Tanacetum cinerariifolium]